MKNEENISVIRLANKNVENLSTGTALRSAYPYYRKDKNKTPLQNKTPLSKIHEISGKNKTLRQKFEICARSAQEKF